VLRRWVGDRYLGEARATITGSREEETRSNTSVASESFPNATHVCSEEFAQLNKERRKCFRKHPNVGLIECDW